MDNLFLTILAAIVLMGLVVLGFLAGWLITGKKRLRRGCGYAPGEKGKKTKSCSICGAEKVCEEEEKKDDDDISRQS